MYRVVEIGLSLTDALKKSSELSEKARKENVVHWVYGNLSYHYRKTEKHFKEGMWLDGITNQNGVRGYTEKSN